MSEILVNKSTKKKSSTEKYIKLCSREYLINIFFKGVVNIF